MRTFFAALALPIAITACTSSGVRVTDDQMSQFHEGVTTKQEVVSALGNPTMTVRNNDGSSALIYSYFEARTRGSSFIPIVGAFVGGADTRQNTVTINFDRSGVMQSYSSTSGETGTATGIATDTDGPVLDQPRK